MSLFLLQHSVSFSLSISLTLVFMKFITELTLFTAACLDLHVSFRVCFFYDHFSHSVCVRNLGWLLLTLIALKCVGMFVCLFLLR